MNDGHQCEKYLEYEGTLGAPGHGQTWKCSRCGKPFHRASCNAMPIAFDDLMVEDVELQPWQVI